MIADVPRTIVSLFLLFFLAGLANGQAKKYALVIGVNQYQNRNLDDLNFAERDATELSEVLSDSGFDAPRLLLGSKSGKDRATKDNIESALDEMLKNKVGKNDLLLIALSGHGQQFAPQGEKEEVPYFCPVGAVPGKAETLVSLASMMKELKERGGGVNLVLVDACRTDPDPNKGTKGGIDGSRMPNLAKGTAVLFACSSGQKSRETDKAAKGHGLLIHRVILGLKDEARDEDGKVTWDLLVAKVKAGVSKDSREYFPGLAEAQHQQAHYDGSITGEPILVGPSVTATHKGGDIVEVKIANGVKMKFCWIPPGEAQLGSPKAERQEVMRLVFGDKSRREQDWVAAEAEEVRGKFNTKGFWLGKYPVTQLEWETVMGKNPSYFSKTGYGKADVAGVDTSHLPVETVSWNDCHDAFLRELNRAAKVSAKMGKGRFVLPHENEWEYACRGGEGNQKPYYFGNELNGKQANCDGRYPFGTTTVGPYLGRPSEVGSYEKLAPHPWGLADMIGNVAQWCENQYTPSTQKPLNDNDFRAVRGDGGGRALDCRSASRHHDLYHIKNGRTGVRVAFRLD